MKISYSRAFVKKKDRKSQKKKARKKSQKKDIDCFD